jgi:putative ABC transport system permease protein
MRYLTDTIKHSLLYYRKDAVNQVIIVALLSAIITGSLFTGHSVRTSLRKNISEKLGNTAIVISTGLRFFDSSLAERISKETGEKAVSLIETEGYCQNFSTGATALNIKIYGITDDFWLFHGKDSIQIVPGTAAINVKLADRIGIKTGDEIIIKFRDTDPIPENAPFAPSNENGSSKVLKVGTILRAQDMGNFDLGISQLVQMNVFMKVKDITGSDNAKSRANRLIVQNTKELPVSSFTEALKKLLVPSDIGLTIRRSQKTGEPELISDRIFIDSAVVAGIIQKLPSATPVITYLGNNIQVGDNSTPYSFITASGYRNIGENEILINRWLAGDLNAGRGDTLTLTWYDPGYSNRLEEKSCNFIISDIVNDDHYYSDPSLMPDFPGISASTTCSGWDAGVPILLDKIRDKDEEYWNKNKGTPKAFINYETGRKLWGSNFGPATALRFPPAEDIENIISKLSGSIDPQKSGFTISDIRRKSIDAAAEGVDFSSLFLGLSMFIIMSCLILLSLAISMFFDSRREQVRTYFALGFRNMQIRNLLFSETLIISATGAIFGVFLGYFFNILIIAALNSVWEGAVQTNTLSSDFSLSPVLTGFFATIIIASLLLYVKSGRFLKSLRRKETGELKLHSVWLNLILFILSLIAAGILLVISFRSTGHATQLYFITGAFIFFALILGLRLYFIHKGEKGADIVSMRRRIEKQFYHFNPSHAITPVIFIAAGIFAVIITSANRQVISDKMLLPSGGTGGFLLWAESAVPVNANLNSIEGRNEFGLDETDLKDLVIVQAKRLTGDDASCLNLNRITSPAVLGLDPGSFISRGSFSFASEIKETEDKNPWNLLEDSPSDNVIYGIADQTVLQWGLRIKTGDTLAYRAENGQSLNIVICAGLKSSVFQGYLIIGRDNFEKYFPSVSGSSIFLADGTPGHTDLYWETLTDRLSRYGLSVMPASEKLASFFVVTNTYLDVFMILGVLGMILGVAGLGFILVRNFNQRKKEFALMLATGYTIQKIRYIILKDQILILICGVLTGIISGLTATLQSLKSGSEMPWNIISIMTALIIAVGISAIFLSIKTVRGSSLVTQLRIE